MPIHQEYSYLPVGGSQQNASGQNGARTWLTPYFDTYRNVFGGDPDGGPLADILRPLEKKHGVPVVCAHWGNYCESHRSDNPMRVDTSAHFVRQFKHTFAQWDHVHSQPPGPATVPHRRPAPREHGARPDRGRQRTRPATGHHAARAQGDPGFMTEEKAKQAHRLSDHRLCAKLGTGNSETLRGPSAATGSRGCVDRHRALGERTRPRYRRFTNCSRP